MNGPWPTRDRRDGICRCRAPGRIAYHPQRPWAALPARSGVVVLDLLSGKTIQKLPPGDCEPILAWHPDGELLAVAHVNEVHVWNVSLRRRTWTLEHRGGGVAVSFNAAGDLLESHGWDNKVNLWDPLSGRSVIVAPVLAGSSAATVCRGSSPLLQTEPRCR